MRAGQSSTVHLKYVLRNLPAPIEGVFSPYLRHILGTSFASRSILACFAAGPVSVSAWRSRFDGKSTPLMEFRRRGVSLTSSPRPVVTQVSTCSGAKALELAPYVLALPVEKIEKEFDVSIRSVSNLMSSCSIDLVLQMFNFPHL